MMVQRLRPCFLFSEQWQRRDAFGSWTKQTASGELMYDRTDSMMMNENNSFDTTLYRAYTKTNICC